MNIQRTVHLQFFGGLCSFLFFTLYLNAQQQNIPLTWQFSRTSENYFEEINEHTSLKPLLQNRLYLNKVDSNFNQSQIDPNLYSYKNDKSKHWFIRKTFHENLIKIDSGNFWLTVDPLLHFSNSIDFADTSGNKIINNTRGVIIRGNIGEKFSFTSSFYENQSYFPNYINQYIESKTEWYYSATTKTWLQRPGYGAVPGQGRSKPFKKSGYDYAFSQGYISFSPNAWINFQAGHDKHFVGDGYRSLLLSDATFNYPFFKTTLWAFNRKLMYTAIYNSLINLERTPNPTTPEANFRNKLGSFHYAAYRFNKFITIGLFEGVIWQRMDSTSTLPFNFNYVNPLPFVSLAQYGFDNKNNVLLGSTLKINLPYKIILYSQCAFGGTISQAAWQAGLKYYGIKNLFFLAEYNFAGQNIYKSSVPFQHYSHYYEPLAHPYGTDFKESVFMLQYKIKRVFADVKCIYAKKNVNLNEMYLPNMYYVSNYNYITLHSLQSSIGFIINKRNNLHVYASYVYRNASIPLSALDNKSFNLPYSRNKLLTLGIKTQLFNTYYDF